MNQKLQKLDEFKSSTFPQWERKQILEGSVFQKFREMYNKLKSFITIYMAQNNFTNQCFGAFEPDALNRTGQK